MNAARLAGLLAVSAAGCNSGGGGLSNQFTNPLGNNPVLNSSLIRGQAPADPPTTVRVAAASVVAAPARPDGPTPDQGSPQVRVVALIGSDVVVTDDEVWGMVRQRAREYISLTGSDRDAKEKELFREELRKLIERELIINDFLTKVKKNKPQALEELKEETEKTAAKRLKDFKKNYNLRSEAEFQAALKSQGLSQKGVVRQLERQAMSELYLSQLMRDKVKVASASLAEVRRYYDTHADEFKVEDQVKWLDLFVSYRRFNTPDEAKQYADWLADQAKGGADFVGLVKKYGHGDSPLRDGEGVGHKRGEVQPAELEPAVFGTAAGQTTAAIPTENGYHIVKVVEREVAGVRPFDERVQLFVRNKLGNVAYKAEYEKLIEDLWRKTTVKVVELP